MLGATLSRKVTKFWSPLSVEAIGVFEFFNVSADEFDSFALEHVPVAFGIMAHGDQSIGEIPWHVHAFEFSGGLILVDLFVTYVLSQGDSESQCGDSRGWATWRFELSYSMSSH